MNTLQLPQLIDGIPCYAPSVAFGNNNYNPEIFQKLYEIESDHFWFRSRNRLIKYYVQKLKGKREIEFLEIGCGTGFVLKGLSTMTGVKLIGSEIYHSGLKFAQKRLPGIELVQLDATRLPLAGRFDIIGAFDVIEHIDEDFLVLQQVNFALKNGGHFIVTVPQHPFLWSYLDDLAFHKRRYTRKEIKLKLQNSGFKVVFVTSLLFFLFPLMWLSRIFKRKRVKGGGIKTEMKELELPWIINRLFGVFMRMDELLIRLGVSLPFGGSLFVICKKI